MKKLAPWEGHEQQKGKYELIRFVTCCIIITNIFIVIFGILAALRANNV